MPSLPVSSTLFEDAIDVPLWLEADRATSYAERLQRDRGLAQRIGNADRLRRVRRWWQQVERADYRSGLGVGSRLQRARRLVSVLMALLGGCSGVAVALAAFHYTGAVPVNLITLLALLVVLPALLAVPGLLLLATDIPGFRWFAPLLRSVHVGALAAALFRRLAYPPAETARLFGWHAGRSAAAGRFAQWQFQSWSQLAAVMFQLACIVTAVVLVAFTDLAFGWSTTLAVEAGTVHAAVTALAWPWQAFLPGAVPDLHLIEQSQFFRLTGAAPPIARNSQVLGGWWPFIVLTLLCYGLLPRLLLLALSQWRLQIRTAALLLEDPRVTALCDRMDNPLVETASSGAEHARLERALPAVGHVPRSVREVCAVIWAGSIERDAVADYARRHLALQVTDIVDAGGERSLDADTAALAALGMSECAAVAVFTRAWEPPLLELLDFLAALRAKLGAGTTIVIVPVAESTGSVSEREHLTWSRAIARLSDPQLYVEVGTP